MRNLTLLLILFSSTLFCQEATYKNDISIGYGFELKHFSRAIGSFTYRREINDSWKAKITAMGNRSYKDYDIMSSIEFTLSDTSIMRRNQYIYHSIGRTLKLGIDYTKLNNFNIGVEMIVGQASGNAYLTDRAFYNLAENPDEYYYGYSEELTEAYHGFQPNATGAIEIGSRSRTVARIDYLAIGLGLTLEAKWPIGNHFEAVLQYNPEVHHLQVMETTVVYNRDGFIEGEFVNFTKFRQFTNLALRCKF